MPVRPGASLACALLALVAGCAGTGTNLVTAIPAGFATDAIAAGGSTKADVAAALGKTASARFDSGFEVWVYRIAGEGRARSPGQAEYVVLFAPSGIVARTRIRPATSM